MSKAEEVGDSRWRSATPRRSAIHSTSVGKAPHGKARSARSRTRVASDGRLAQGTRQGTGLEQINTATQAVNEQHQEHRNRPVPNYVDNQNLTTKSITLFLV